MTRAVSGVLVPMLATLVEAPVDLPGWVYEEKYDGDRTMAYRRGGRVRLYSRNLHDVTDAYPEIARALAALPGGDFVLDGEIVAFDAHGVSRFQLLQQRGMGKGIAPVFAVFDCLERDGKALIARPLAERRRALEAIVPERRGPVMRARRLPADGRAAYETARARDWEGIIAKDNAAPYEPGKRSRAWLKVKVHRQGEFVIGGFTAPKGGRQHFGALLLGLYDEEQLRYVGKVGTGFSERTLADLGSRMAALVTDRSPFEPPPRERATWLRPELVAQIAFAEWTADGKLRQPRFLGPRHDKRAADCRWNDRER